MILNNFNTAIPLEEVLAIIQNNSEIKCYGRNGIAIVPTEDGYKEVKCTIQGSPDRLLVAIIWNPDGPENDMIVFDPETGAGLRYDESWYDLSHQPSKREGKYGEYTQRETLGLSEKFGTLEDKPRPYIKFQN